MSSLPYAKKALGQHWLTDEATLAAICQAAEIGPDDVVLEIGPGVGTLTKLLVRQARQVIAVELDAALAADLPNNVPARNLKIVHQDILQFDLTTLPPDYKVVANIPYYLTSNLLRVLSESANPPSSLVLLVQKEVAERVATKPGAMSLLAVSVQLYYHPALGQIVPARLFTPPPQVDSQILKLTRHAEPLFPQLNHKLFFQIVKAGFAARRKTLLNALAGGLRLDKAAVQAILEPAGIKPSQRAQNLGLADWYKLYVVYQNHLTS